MAARTDKGEARATRLTKTNGVYTQHTPTAPDGAWVWAKPTGKEEDVEVGLVYFGKRYLNTQLQRWVRADPLEVHSAGQADANLYAYVSGQALKNIDPLGLQKITSNPNERNPVRTGPGQLSAEAWSRKYAPIVEAKLLEAGVASGQFNAETEVDSRVVAVLIAQPAMETDRGLKIYNWNIGNIKLFQNGRAISALKAPHHYLGNVREEYDSLEAAQDAMRRYGKGTYVHAPNKTKQHHVYYHRAPSDGSRFRSYDTEAEGQQAWLDHVVSAGLALQKHLTEAEAAGREVTAKELASVYLGQRALQGYATAGEYKSGLVFRYNELADHVAERMGADNYGYGYDNFMGESSLRVEPARTQTIRD